MLVQYSKFSKMAAETNWRQDIASLTYIETSTWTRQEHNGFSHQVCPFTFVYREKWFNANTHHYPKLNRIPDSSKPFSPFLRI